MKWLIGIIVLIIVVIGGWYIWQGASTASPQTTATSTAPTQSGDIIFGIPNTTYTDPHLSFSIEYPGTANVSSDFSTGYLPLTQTPVVAFELPTSMFSGTNLTEAGVYIGATTTPSVMTACADPSMVEGATSTSMTTVGGQQFLTYSTTGAAAGNIYQEKVFRAFQNGYCLEIVELLHSGDIGNYSTGTVQQFNQAQFSGILDSIVQTYYPIPTGE